MLRESAFDGRGGPLVADGCGMLVACTARLPGLKVVQFLPLNVAPWGPRSLVVASSKLFLGAAELRCLPEAFSLLLHSQLAGCTARARALTDA